MIFQIIYKNISKKYSDINKFEKSFFKAKFL